jgi:phosphoribosylanthranilate isomerase
MLRLKICGITTPDDARLAAEAGADAIGLNFYTASPRHITREKAREIIAALPAGVARVGVFVNAQPRAVCALYDELGLSFVQLHGDEPPGALVEFSDRRIIKAFRYRNADMRPIGEYVEECLELKCPLAGVLIDAFAPGKYGGTGKTLDWRLLREAPDYLHGLPLILAGGLTPANVADAIREARPQGVDVASGVETAPGKKDPLLVQQFVQAARDAFEWPKPTAGGR